MPCGRSQRYPLSASVRAVRSARVVPIALMRSMSMGKSSAKREFSHGRRPATVGAMAMPPTPVRYWRRTLQLTGALLLLWFGVTFGIAYFARDLDFDFFGWPFSFWVASQGALLVYLVLVGVYALAMQRLD